MRRCVPVVAMVATLAAAAEARSQGGVLVQGVADVEGWATSRSSNLLTRNGADPGAVLRLQLWTAVEPWRGIFIYGHGRAEGGNARAFGDTGVDARLEQGGVRLARDPRFVVNGGRMVHPVGGFGPRVLSTRNPLIGIPDGYSPVYPFGAMIGGVIGQVDYRIAAVTLPLTHRGYVPEADAAARPVVGIGITPIVGLRIGASATDGSYLNRELSASQLNGRSWRDYRQRVIAAEVQYGIGHLDLRGEYAHGQFEVPYRGPIDGHTEYLEGRYTVTPRLFVAARAEVNDYPFIRPTSQTTWVSRRTEFMDYEAGFGFRFTESMVVKASYRVDKWKVTPQNSSFVGPGGQAFAVQLSQAFDVMEWVGRLR